MTAAAHSKTANLALPLVSTRSEVAFHMTRVHNKPVNICAPPSPPISKAPIPYKTKGLSWCFANPQSFAGGKFPHLQHWTCEASPAFKSTSNLATTTQKTASYHNNKYLHRESTKTDEEQKTRTGSINSPLAKQPSYQSKEKFMFTHASCSGCNHPSTTNLPTGDF